jgi:uncharacterized membrane protein
MLGLTMRQIRARVAITVLSITVLSAGLIVASATAGSAAASISGPGGLLPGCTWTIHTLPLPSGWSDPSVIRGDGGSSFAGWATDPAGVERPLLWRRGTVTVLNSLGGANAGALDVNRRGVVLAFTRSSLPRPFIWVNGRIVPLAVPAGAQSTIGYAINDAGIVVGSSIIDGASHGIVWSLDSPQRYRDLGIGDGELSLTDVTQAGIVVGGTRTPGDEGTFRAVRGTVRGGFSSLPGLDPTHESFAARAAGRYIIGVGHLPDAAPDQSGVLWNGNLATALPPSMGALAVNSRGLVAGYVSGQVATWAAGTTWTLPDLSDFAPLGNSSASDVMEDGTVIGVSTADDGSLVPVTWVCT